MQGKLSEVELHVNWYIIHCMHIYIHENILLNHIKVNAICILHLMVIVFDVEMCKLLSKYN